MIRFATIGSGRAAERFLREAKKHPEFELAAVYSRTEERGQAFAAEMGAPKVYTDLAALAADPEIDAVYIASPNLAHAEQALALMKAKKHILCEKPMATTYVDCDGLVLAAHNSGVVLLEAMPTLFCPGFAKLHELIPEVGQLRRITANYCRTSPYYEQYKNGGRPNAFNHRLNNAAITECGVFCIAPTVAMMGEPERVASVCTKLGDYEAQGSISAQYPGVLVEWNYSNITTSALPSEIQGEEGSILVGNWETMSPLTLCKKGEEPREIALPEDAPSGYYGELDAFIQMVKARGGSESFLSISLATTRITDEVRKQNRVVFQTTCWNPVVCREDYGYSEHLQNKGF